MAVGRPGEGENPVLFEVGELPGRAAVYRLAPDVRDAALRQRVGQRAPVRRAAQRVEERVDRRREVEESCGRVAVERRDGDLPRAARALVVREVSEGVAVGRE